MQPLALLSRIAAAPATVAAPRFGQGADLAIPWARITLGFLFCVTLAVVAILLIRQRQGLGTSLERLWPRLRGQAPGDTQADLRIEQRLRVTPASQVLVLRYQGVRYLLHVSPQGAQVLDRLDDAASPGGGTA